MDSLFGMKVVIEPLRQRYTLPPDVPPPKGMTRDDFNAWSRSVCGFQPSLLGDGVVFKTGNTLTMNDRTWQMTSQALKGL